MSPGLIGRCAGAGASALAWAQGTITSSDTPVPVTNNDSSFLPFANVDVSDASVFEWGTDITANDRLDLKKAGIYLIQFATLWTPHSASAVYGLIDPPILNLWLSFQTVANTVPPVSHSPFLAWGTEDIGAVVIDSARSTRFRAGNFSGGSASVEAANGGVIYLGALA